MSTFVLYFLFKGKVRTQSTVRQPSAGTFVTDLHHNYFKLMKILF